MACVCGRDRTEARERHRGEGDRVHCPVYRARLTFGLNSVNALELRDRVVGSGPAEQTKLSAGSDPAMQTFGLN